MNSGEPYPEEVPAPDAANSSPLLEYETTPDLLKIPRSNFMLKFVFFHDVRAR